MPIVRVVLAVIVGYLVYAIFSMLLAQPVLEQAETFVVVASLAGLVLIGLMAGFVAHWIGREMSGVAVCIMAGLIALATIANLIMQLGAEPMWYKIGTLLLTVPAALWIGTRRSNTTNENAVS